MVNSVMALVFTNVDEMDREKRFIA